ncbi:hypothetical protein ACOSQ3_002720 [Xanthoceras sorbifolium]
MSSSKAPFDSIPESSYLRKKLVGGPNDLGKISKEKRKARAESCEVRRPRIARMLERAPKVVSPFNFIRPPPEDVPKLSSMIPPKLKAPLLAEDDFDANNGEGLIQQSTRKNNDPLVADSRDLTSPADAAVADLPIHAVDKAKRSRGTEAFPMVPFSSEDVLGRILVGEIIFKDQSKVEGFLGDSREGQQLQSFFVFSALGERRPTKKRLQLSRQRKSRWQLRRSRQWPHLIICLMPQLPLKLRWKSGWLALRQTTKSYPIRWMPSRS